MAQASFPGRERGSQQGHLPAEGLAQSCGSHAHRGYTNPSSDTYVCLLEWLTATKVHAGGDT